MFGWFKKESKTNKEFAIEKFKKIGLTFEEADYLAQDIAEVNLYTDRTLFKEDDGSVHNLEEAFKDKYFMSTVNSIIEETPPVLIRDLAYTGIQARAYGLDFEVRMALKRSVFDYLETNELDNLDFREIFLQTLDTVTVTKEESPLMDLLYSKGWIEDVNNKHYIDSANKMIDVFGEDQALRNIHTLLDECALWHKQVDNPASPLQKMTSLSLSWMGGELDEIKNNILVNDTSPFDLLLNTLELHKQIKKALKYAEENEDFPEMDDAYRDDVSARFIQYLQEETRLNIIDKR